RDGLRYFQLVIHEINTVDRREHSNRTVARRTDQYLHGLADHSLTLPVFEHFLKVHLRDVAEAYLFYGPKVTFAARRHSPAARYDEIRIVLTPDSESIVLFEESRADKVQLFATRIIRGNVIVAIDVVEAAAVRVDVNIGVTFFTPRDLPSS